MNLAELDKHHVWHPFTQMAAWEKSAPLIIERAEGNTLIDTQGNRYLDGVSSLWVTVHGHRCPEIDQAIREQLDRVAHSTLLGLANVPSIALAAELVRISPESLTHVFYSDSGSSAIEVALKMAFQYWQLQGRAKRTRFLTLEQAYHGDTIGAVSVGGIDIFHRIFHPLLFETLRVRPPHPYRAEGEARDHPDRCRDAALAQLDDALRWHADEVAAVIVEPRIQGAAGMIVHPPGYLAGVAQLCAKHHTLLICDEVATGFGRTGEMFSCQAEGVQPDLMAVAKGLTGGYLPLAATLASDRIYQAFLGKREQTFFHGHTYTGNPLACAAALASLRLFATRDVLTQVKARSETLSRLLAKRIACLAPVGQVRQLGLMVGVELVAQRETRQPLPAEALTGHRVCLALRQRGVILRPLGDVIVLMPPLSVTVEELTTMVSALSDAILEVFR